MLFLYRPRQTWMPYARPRDAMRQDEYNLRTQQQFEATRRVAPAGAQPAAVSAEDNAGKLRQLAQLHESGVLTDEEYNVAKSRLSGPEDQPT